ncbi:MAG: aminotransferase class V-fold PLP-dependent enzyme, partial [Bacteroidota bacterium]
EKDRVALIPAASYGIATVAGNVPVIKGQNLIVVEDQFPSNYYAWAELAKRSGAELRVVARPELGSEDSWSNRVFAAIDGDTAVVAIAQLHWADGTLFDLRALRSRTDEVNAWLVIDGTQSLGAMPFDVREVRPDAVVAGGYKWLMGPYGCGYAWYGPRMDDGRPLEENWINRAGSEDFRNLVNYTDAYRPLAARYSVGEHSNFIMAPMQLAGLQQVNTWGQEATQAYCAKLWETVTPSLLSLGVLIPRVRAQHLVGLRLPASVDGERMRQEIGKRGLHVSYRGDALRVSPSVYNTAEEMIQLVMAIAVAKR